MESYLLEISRKTLILEEVSWILRLEWSNLTSWAMPSTFSLGCFFFKPQTVMCYIQTAPGKASDLQKVTPTEGISWDNS